MKFRSRAGKLKMAPGFRGLRCQVCGHLLRKHQARFTAGGAALDDPPVACRKCPGRVCVRADRPWT
jgi:hypothetical protein